MVILNSLYFLVYSLYPLISHNVNLANLKFDLDFLLQEILAYSLFVLGITLAGRSRVVWILTIINLFAMLIIFNLLKVTAYHSNILIISTIIILVLSYQTFERQLYLSYGFGLVFAFIIQALCYGVFGTYVMRNQFHGVETINDAIYFSMETYSTVGYGDVYPITKAAKYFVVSMITIGLIMFTSGITFVGYLFSNKLHSILFNINKGKISMNNHVVLIGFGIMGKILSDKYQRLNTDFIVIDVGNNMDTDREILREKDLLIISPYPGHKETLSRARVNEAKIVIVNFETDADTILALMNVSEFIKDYKNKPKVLARVYYEDNISKAKLAGADFVIAPHVMVAEEIENWRTKLQ